MTLQARQDGLLVQEVGDELVIYDQKRDIIQALNPTTALVWRHCDGQTSITEMAALLAQELGLPRDEDLVWLTLEQLEKARLLRESLSHTTDAGKVSRREVVRNLGLVGGLALLLPVISSITAPTPAMAQSPDGGAPPDGGSVDAPLDEESISPPSDHDTIGADPVSPEERARRRCHQRCQERYSPSSREWANP